MSSTDNPLVPADPAAGSDSVPARASPSLESKTGGGCGKTPPSGPCAPGGGITRSVPRPPWHLPNFGSRQTRPRHKSPGVCEAPRVPARGGSGSEETPSSPPRAVWGGESGGPCALCLSICRMSIPCGGGAAPARLRRSGCWPGGMRRAGGSPIGPPGPNPSRGCGGAPGPSSSPPPLWFRTTCGAAGRSHSKSLMSPRIGLGGPRPGGASRGPCSGWAAARPCPPSRSTAGAPPRKSGCAGPSLRGALLSSPASKPCVRRPAAAAVCPAWYLASLRTALRLSSCPA